MGRGVGTHKQYTQFGPLSRERAFSLLDILWAYDWSLTPAKYPGLESVQMVWGKSGVGVLEGGYGDWVMGFNEPDSVGQANMSLADCARLWKRLTELNPGRKFVSPVPTADNPAWRWDWLREYEADFGEMPKVDAVAVHIYPQKLSYFEEMLAEAWRFARKFDVRLWVTEYAYLPGWDGGMQAAAHMMGEMTRYLASRPEQFERYAPFILGHRGDEGWGWGPRNNVSLVSMDTGQLTQIGQAYVDARPKYADPRCDITGPKGVPDGRVDIFDLALMGANFGMEVE